MVSLGKPGPAGWIPWAYWTEYVVNDLFLTHKGPYSEKEKASLLGWATTGAILFSIPQLVQKIGLGTIGWFSAIYYTGKWTSQIIDPEEGKENYYGFISGGIWGNEPSYGSQQRPGSGGYFDIAGNLAIILHFRKNKKKKNSETTTFTQDAITMDDLNMEQRVELGFITPAEYVTWFNAEISKMTKAKELKAQWNALDKSEQKNIIATRVAMDRQFAGMEWN